MLGWKIFTHAVGMLFRNFGAALRISLLLYIATQLVGYWALTWMMEAVFTRGQGAALGGPMVLNMIVAIVTTIWIAVGWHRFVLIEENPTAVIAPFNGSAMWSYFVASLKVVLLGLVIMIPIIAVTLFVTNLLGMDIRGPSPMGPAAGGGYIVGIAVAAVAMGLVMLRLGLILPAAAIGKPMTMRESREATAGRTGSLFLLLVVLVALSTASNWLGGKLVGGAQLEVHMAVSAVFGWFAMMINVSALTTLYGHLVEGRELV